MRKLTPLLILHTHTHTVSLNHTNVYSVYTDILCVMIHMMYHTVMHHTHNSHKKSVSYHIYIYDIYILSLYIYTIYTYTSTFKLSKRKICNKCAHTQHVNIQKYY